MKRFKYETVFVTISLIVSALAYLMTNNKYAAIGVFAAYLLILLFYVAPMFKRGEERRRKREEAYRFINRFSITLSSSSSALEAFSRALEDNDSSSFKSINERIGYLSTVQKIVYLDDYFSTPFYSVFISVYKLYEEAGGDFLLIADPLIKEMNLEMEHQHALEKESRRKLGEFITLWTLSMAILLFMRLALKSLFPYMSSSLPYLISALAYFLLVLVSIAFFSIVYLDEKKERKEKRA